MNNKIGNPIPDFFNVEQHSLSTKKDRKKCFADSVLPPKAPIRSCPVPRTISVFKHDQPRPVSFKEDSDTTFISQSPFYTSKKKVTYFEQCYTLEKTLGKGSFGEVFKVYSKESGLPYACKKTLLKYRGKSDRSRRIEEVKKHEQLPSHLNCVKFFRAWEEKDHLYLLTEVCQASLAEIMAKNHEMPESLIWSYLCDIMQGLHHLHEHQLIHMDVKPENIFLGVDGYCKLGDFGLVIDFSRGYPTEAVEGDPKYLAPECLQNIYTEAADFFSLGIVALEMATDLYLPQFGPPWHELRNGTVPQVAREAVSAELTAVLEGFLNPNPQDRLTAAMAFQYNSIKRIAKNKQLAIYLNSKVNKVKSILHSILLWPWSLFTFVFSILNCQWILNYIQNYMLRRLPKCQTSEEPNLNDSLNDELDCNFSDDESMNSFLIPSPLVKSTPIMSVKRRVFPPLSAIDNPSIEDKNTSLVKKFSFNESSFSSLEHSREDLSKPLEDEPHLSTLSNNVTSRNLLELFNTVSDSDSE